MGTAPPFDSLYRHGFARVAVCVPRLRVGDPDHNVAETLHLARQADEGDAVLALFPELGLSAYSAEDLFHQHALLERSLSALETIVEASRDLRPVLLVGLPMQLEHKLFNVAAIVHRGVVLGLVPKSYLPNYREFYEKRQFVAARDAIATEVGLFGRRVPFGTDLVFHLDDIEGFALHAEICEDVWAPIPPSTYAALGGATVLANLSASNVTVGKADYRRMLCASHSARCVAAYLYSAAGAGESTTDLAWDGHALVYENGDRVAESERFAGHSQVVFGDLDLDRLVQDRMRQTSLSDSVSDHRGRVIALRHIHVHVGIPNGRVTLQRPIARFPYVPADPRSRNERCGEVYQIQVQGLATRLRATGIDKVVIGVSGGLDSTQALLVCVQAMDDLGLPRTNVLAYTMPGFATSDGTLANSLALMEQLGVTATQIDIRPSCLQMLADLDHPFVNGEPLYDVTFENVQAGERTSHLFRLANHHHGLVVGTGDLSELALGWCTYGVGDQMSHYNVNASVPKTLIQYLIRWVVERSIAPPANETLLSILDTEISPELVPHTNGADHRALRAAGLPPLLCGPLRVSAEQGCLPRPRGVGRPHQRVVARSTAGREAQRIRSDHDPSLARGVPAALLRHQSVQALGDAQRPQGRLRRVTVAPRRLAGTERRSPRRLAVGAARQRSPQCDAPQCDAPQCGVPQCGVPRRCAPHGRAPNKLRATET
jgi:NAD+ synthase (glutamine-hydrolysing)